ncbi:MAG: 16S rRNA (adenine(1518)-N(6)/adenine(1519)-N(6))-dimethyltransferase [Gammaproteobacteria bacterium]|nr:MAG: 16S rRNA (adenine(1518)-N(6)/adenine(1519)-N(6))-dimethyltransferase [Gammaproteobacteria bacterium]
MGNLSNHRARKRFGQNFLHDQGIIHRIVMAISPKPGQHIVEIGPGLGALTKEVLPLVGVMDAIELDRDLIPKLEHMAEDVGTLRIHSGDALKFDFSTLIEGEEQLRVFGNLPYNISTPLIFHLCAQGQLIKEMHFMLQKEVVDRMVAGPGSKRYGRLSIMVQYFCQVRCLFFVPARCFTPAPKVESAIVRLQPHSQKPFLANDEKLFSKLVTTAFNHRRKTLRNAVKEMVTEQQLIDAGVSPDVRPETIGLEQFVAIANRLSQG